MSWADRLKEKLARKGAPSQLTEPTEGAFGGFGSSHPPAVCDNTQPPGALPPSSETTRAESQELRREISHTGAPPQLTEPTKGAFGGFGGSHPPPLWENPPPPIPHEDQQAIDEAIAERAAIREFDGGEPRAIAEREARSAMRVYQYRITDKPATWLTLIAPGCDLNEARRIVTNQFGAARVLDVVPYRAGGIGARSPDDPPGSIERGNNT
jgi:hypothetical protein